jgi:hypothetical protein
MGQGPLKWKCRTGLNAGNERLLATGLSHVHEDAAWAQPPNRLESPSDVAYMMARQLADYGDKRRVE